MQTLIRWSWVFGLIGVLALLGAGGVAYVLGTLDGPATYLLVGGAIALLLFGFLDRDRLGEAVQSKSFLYGSGSSLMVAMVAAIAVAAYLVARDHDETWDLTRDKAFTLSDQTQQVVGSMDQEVQVLAFFQNESPDQHQFRDLIDRYTELSPKVKVDWIDPLRNPRLAEQHEVTGEHGVVVLQRADGETRRIETEPTEEKLTNAIVTLLADEEHRICWSLGHGEPDPDEEYSDRGLGAVVTEIEQLNYQITKSFLATTGIERECEALVIVRPQTDFLPYEREALAAYLASGGRALVALEPALTPELAADLARYGVNVGDDIVVDYNPKNMLLGVDDPSFVVLTDDNIQRHPITRNLSAAIVLPISRSVSPVEGRPEGLKVDVLLRTSDQAWGETSTDQGEVQPNEGEVVGEVPVAAAIEISDPSALGVAAPGVPAAPAPPSDADPSAPPSIPVDAARGVPADFAPKAGGRLVVVGDSDFPNNVFLAWGNNRDLFLNVLAWLVDEEEQIGERPEEGDTLEITAVGEAMLCLLSLVVVPGAAVAFAAATLLRRRWL